jgi:MinD-like ATPase involved in chromosome partitioning or flagellar assembly
LGEVILLTKVGNLYLVPAGWRSPEVVNLLSAGAMEQLIKGARERFDIIVDDSSAHPGRKRLLSSLVDYLIIMVHHRRFPRAMLMGVKKIIKSIDTRALGVVLNQVDVRQNKNYQYYTSYNQ